MRPWCNSGFHWSDELLGWFGVWTTTFLARFLDSRACGLDCALITSSVHELAHVPNTRLRSTDPRERVPAQRRDVEPSNDLATRVRWCSGRRRRPAPARTASGRRRRRPAPARTSSYSQRCRRSGLGRSRRLGAVADGGLARLSLRRGEQIDPQADHGLQIRRVRSGVDYGLNRVDEYVIDPYSARMPMLEI